MNIKIKPKEQIEQILSQETINTNDTKQLSKLKDQILPTKLYKYREVNNYSLDNLENSTIWIDTPNSYDDKNDCKIFADFTQPIELLSKENFSDLIGPQVDITQNEISQCLNSKDPIKSYALLILQKSTDISSDIKNRILLVFDSLLNKAKKEITTSFDKSIRHNLKVCSFCESYNSTKMWNKYAHNNQGFCMEYDLSKLPKNDIRKKLLWPVLYKKSSHDLTPLFLNFIKHRENANNLMILLSLLTKNKFRYDFEQEWRLIIQLENKSFKLQNYPFSCLSAVYLGTEISIENKNRLIEISKNKNIPVYNMTWNAGKLEHQII